MIGPFELEMKVRLTDGDRSAEVTYNFPVGKCPTKDDVDKAMKSALDETQKQVGSEWRLQTRNEFENEVLSERYGGTTPHFATREEWDAE